MDNKKSMNSHQRIYSDNSGANSSYRRKSTNYNMTSNYELIQNNNTNNNININSKSNNINNNSNNNMINYQNQSTNNKIVNSNIPNMGNCNRNVTSPINNKGEKNIKGNKFDLNNKNLMEFDQFESSSSLNNLRTTREKNMINYNEIINFNSNMKQGYDDTADVEIITQKDNLHSNNNNTKINSKQKYFNRNNKSKSKSSLIANANDINNNNNNNLNLNSKNYINNNNIIHNNNNMNNKNIHLNINSNVNENKNNSNNIYNKNINSGINNINKLKNSKNISIGESKNFINISKGVMFQKPQNMDEMLNLNFNYSNEEFFKISGQIKNDKETFDDNPESSSKSKRPNKQINVNDIYIQEESSHVITNGNQINVRGMINKNNKNSQNFDSVNKEQETEINTQHLRINDIDVNIVNNINPFTYAKIISPKSAGVGNVLRITNVTGSTNLANHLLINKNNNGNIPQISGNNSNINPNIIKNNINISNSAIPNSLANEDKNLEQKKISMRNINLNNNEGANLNAEKIITNQENIIYNKYMNNSKNERITRNSSINHYFISKLGHGGKSTSKTHTNNNSISENPNNNIKNVNITNNLLVNIETHNLNEEESIFNSNFNFNFTNNKNASANNFIKKKSTHKSSDFSMNNNPRINNYGYNFDKPKNSNSNSKYINNKVKNSLNSNNNLNINFNNNISQGNNNFSKDPAITNNNNNNNSISNNISNNRQGNFSSSRSPQRKNLSTAKNFCSPIAHKHKQQIKSDKILSNSNINNNNNNNSNSNYMANTKASNIDVNKINLKNFLAQNKEHLKANNNKTYVKSNKASNSLKSNNITDINLNIIKSIQNSAGLNINHSNNHNISYANMYSNSINNVNNNLNSLNRNSTGMLNNLYLNNVPQNNNINSNNTVNKNAGISNNSNIASNLTSGNINHFSYSNSQNSNSLHFQNSYVNNYINKRYNMIKNSKNFYQEKNNFDERQEIGKIIEEELNFNKNLIPAAITNRHSNNSNSLSSNINKTKNINSNNINLFSNRSLNSNNTMGTNNTNENLVVNKINSFPINYFNKANGSNTNSNENVENIVITEGIHIKEEENLTTRYTSRINQVQNLNIKNMNLNTKSLDFADAKNKNLEPHTSSFSKSESENADNKKYTKDKDNKKDADKEKDYNLKKAIENEIKDSSFFMAAYPDLDNNNDNNSILQTREDENNQTLRYNFKNENFSIANNYALSHISNRPIAKAALALDGDSENIWFGNNNINNNNNDSDQNISEKKVAPASAASTSRAENNIMNYITPRETSKNQGLNASNSNNNTVINPSSSRKASNYSKLSSIDEYIRSRNAVLENKNNSSCNNNNSRRNTTNSNQTYNNNINNSNYNINNNISNNNINNNVNKSLIIFPQDESKAINMIFDNKQNKNPEKPLIPLSFSSKTQNNTQNLENNHNNNNNNDYNNSVDLTFLKNNMSNILTNFSNYNNNIKQNFGCNYNNSISVIVDNSENVKNSVASEFRRIDALGDIFTNNINNKSISQHGYGNCHGNSINNNSLANKSKNAIAKNYRNFSISNQTNKINNQSFDASNISISNEIQTNSKNTPIKTERDDLLSERNRLSAQLTTQNLTKLPKEKEMVNPFKKSEMKKPMHDAYNKLHEPVAQHEEEFSQKNKAKNFSNNRNSNNIHTPNSSNSPNKNKPSPNLAFNLNKFRINNIDKNSTENIQIIINNNISYFNSTNAENPQVLNVESYINNKINAYNITKNPDFSNNSNKNKPVVNTQNKISNINESNDINNNNNVYNSTSNSNNIVNINKKPNTELRTIRTIDELDTINNNEEAEIFDDMTNFNADILSFSKADIFLEDNINNINNNNNNNNDFKNSDITPRKNMKIPMPMQITDSEIAKALSKQIKGSIEKSAKGEDRALHINDLNVEYEINNLATAIADANANDKSNILNSPDINESQFNFNKNVNKFSNAEYSDLTFDEKSIEIDRNFANNNYDILERISVTRKNKNQLIIVGAENSKSQVLGSFANLNQEESLKDSNANNIFYNDKQAQVDNTSAKQLRKDMSITYLNTSANANANAFVNNKLNLLDANINNTSISNNLELNSQPTKKFEELQIFNFSNSTNNHNFKNSLKNEIEKIERFDYLLNKNTINNVNSISIISDQNNNAKLSSAGTSTVSENNLTASNKKINMISCEKYSLRQIDKLSNRFSEDSLNKLLLTAKESKKANLSNIGHTSPFASANANGNNNNNNYSKNLEFVNADAKNINNNDERKILYQKANPKNICKQQNDRKFNLNYRFSGKPEKQTSDEDCTLSEDEKANITNVPIFKSKRFTSFNINNNSNIDLKFQKLDQLISPKNNINSSLGLGINDSSESGWNYMNRPELAYSGTDYNDINNNNKNNINKNPSKNYFKYSKYLPEGFLVSLFANSQKTKNKICSFLNLKDLISLSYVDKALNREIKETIYRIIKTMIIKESNILLRLKIWKSIFKYSKLSEAEDLKSIYLEYLSVESSYKDAILKDINRTLPEDHTFRSGKMNNLKLNNVLNAYSNFNKKIGYAQGLNFIVAAIILILNEEEQVFLFVDSLIKKFKFNKIMGVKNSQVRAHLDLIQLYLEKYVPNLCVFLSKHGLSHEFFSTNWIITIFANVVSHSTLFKIWDFFVIFGWKFFNSFLISIMWKYEKTIMRYDANYLSISLKTLMKSKEFDLDFEDIVNKAFEIMKNENFSETYK